MNQIFTCQNIFKLILLIGEITEISLSFVFSLAKIDQHVQREGGRNNFVGLKLS